MARVAIQYKTRGEFQAMRAAGLILARAIEAGRAAVRPGASTADVDAAVASVITDAGAVSNFKGYHGFPATICASVNDEVVHGIPSAARVLAEGDLLSIDAGCVLDGWHADSAVTVHVGAPPAGPDGLDEVALIAATEAAMWAGIAAARAGAHLGDVSFAIQTSGEQSGRTNGHRYGSVAGYGGHGIGTAMHMEPFVANQGKRGKGPKLTPGMALAIEPMLSLGRPPVRELADGWTVVTRDGKRAAHVEHSIAIVSAGVSVLTAHDAGVAGLAPFGVVPVSLD